MNTCICLFVVGYLDFSILDSGQVEEFGDQGIILYEEAHMEDEKKVWTTG